MFEILSLDKYFEIDSSLSFKFFVYLARELAQRCIKHVENTNIPSRTKSPALVRVGESISSNSNSSSSNSSIPTCSLQEGNDVSVMAEYQCRIGSGPQATLYLTNRIFIFYFLFLFLFFFIFIFFYFY